MRAYHVGRDEELRKRFGQIALGNVYDLSKTQRVEFGKPHAQALRRI